MVWSLEAGSSNKIWRVEKGTEQDIRDPQKKISRSCETRHGQYTERTGDTGTSDRRIQRDGRGGNERRRQDSGNKGRNGGRHTFYKLWIYCPNISIYLSILGHYVKK